MLIPITFLWFIGFVCSSYYPPVDSLENYHNLWKAFENKLHTIDLRHLAFPDEGDDQAPYNIYV